MPQSQRTPDVYGPGTYTDKTTVPAPVEAERIFRLLASQTPGFTQDETLLSKVRFSGEPYPVLPGPIKAVPVTAALHAMAGIVADEILSLRPGGQFANKDRRVSVNTTHAAFWLSTITLLYVDGVPLSKANLSVRHNPAARAILPDWEGDWMATPLGVFTTGIFPTRTPGVWYSLHGSTDPASMLRGVLGVADFAQANEGIDTPAQAREFLSQRTRQMTASEIEVKNLEGGFCGGICYTPKQWRETSMGKSLAAHPTINVRPVVAVVAAPHTTTTLPGGPPPPTPFPPTSTGNGRRVLPLEGIRVVELTRIIAGPTVGAVLAAFGADVIRVSAPHLVDINSCQLSLNAGKQTVGLDLRDPADAARLRGLVASADVFIQGFRPGSLAARQQQHHGGGAGLAVEELAGMAARRGKGIVCVSVSCYGPAGYYAERPGWQQVADGASGAAHVMGRAYGLAAGECALPALPISDGLAGLAGAVGTMMALRDRAVRGGSYRVDAALVAVDVLMLSEAVGLYPPEAVRACQDRFGWEPMGAGHHVYQLMQLVEAGWRGHATLGAYLREDSGWFQSWEESAFGGKRLSLLRPVVRFVLDDGDGGGEEEVGVSPRWKTPSVPNAWMKKEMVAWRADGNSGSRGWLARCVDLFRLLFRRMLVG